MAVVTIKKLKEGMFSDPKTGWSAYPFMYALKPESDVALRDLHVVSIYSGQVRGNHYHDHSTELLFFFAGKGSFIWEEDGRVKEERLAGTPVMITIPPGIKHAFKNTGESTVYLLAVRDEDHDPTNPDTVRSVIAT